MRRGPKPRDPMSRFMEKVEKTDTCWLWTAATFTNGYGAFRVGANQRRAHRWVYETLNGPIPVTAVVMHSCDVRRCVNPAHLSIGSQKDNQQDMSAKGRSAGKQNMRANPPKLSMETADEIRRVYRAGGVTQAELAKTYGVSQTLISHIAGGTRWGID